MVAFFSCLEVFAQDIPAEQSSNDTLEKPTLAVYVGGKKESEEIKKVFASKVVSAIVEQGKYEAVERTASFLEQISNETSYQKSGAVSESMLAQIGLQLGANFVCAIDILDVLGEKYVVGKIIDVQTAVVVCSKDVEGKWENLTELSTIARDLANKLTGASTSDGSTAGKYVSIIIERSGCCSGN